MDPPVDREFDNQHQQVMRRTISNPAFPPHRTRAKLVRAVWTMTLIHDAVQLVTPLQPDLPAIAPRFGLYHYLRFRRPETMPGSNMKFEAELHHPLMEREAISAI